MIEREALGYSSAGVLVILFPITLQLRYLNPSTLGEYRFDQYLQPVSAASIIYFEKDWPVSIIQGLPIALYFPSATEQ